MKTNPAQLIGPQHPSFGCSQALFVFAIKNPHGEGFGRILLVKAENPWAVQTIERVAWEGQVNPTCELLSVHREVTDLGTRSDLAEEIGYVDFMLDIVETSRLLEDVSITTAFDQSLTDKDRKYARAKLAETPEAVEDTPRHLQLVHSFDPTQSSNYQTATAALSDLGFKKPQVKKMLDDLGPEVDQMSLESVIKACLQGARG